MQNLCKHSLRDQAAGVREGRWSASELVRAHASRIQVRDAEVQAWEHLDLARASDAAKALDASDPVTAGGLAGVPVAVKDIIDVAGMPTRYGSPIYAAAGAARASAQCVQALERAGAIVVGKTVTTEFAYYTPRKTRNPWNVRHTPGGSSMGSAASVACGMAAAALGTQTNGSVIRPAAFCGVVGFKPSFGAVSNHGTLDPWPTLDHTGVFARSVADAALMASIVSSCAKIGSDVAMPARAPTLALVRSPVWDLAEAPQRDTLAACADKLRRAGARVEEAELPPAFADAHRVHRLIMAYEGAQHFHALQREHRDAISAAFNALLDEGAAIAQRDYRAAIASAQSLREAFATWVARYDALITPPAAGEAPATLEQTGNPAFCTIWTLLGAPAITLPVELGPAGLPLGLQIVAACGDDHRLLCVAAWCEAQLPFRNTLL